MSNESAAVKDFQVITGVTAPQNQNIKPAGRAKPGRPRSNAARDSIMDAARRMMSHTALRDISIEAIAKRAGVGKTTIYRWWPNKASILIEAFMEQPGLQNILPTTVSPADAVEVQLEKLIRQLRGQNGRIVANILAEGQADREAVRLFDERFMDERRQNLRHHLQQGRSNGIFRNDLDLDMAMDMLLGPIFYRLMSQADGLDEAFAGAYPFHAVAALKA